MWDEPSIGRLFGGFYRKAQKRQLTSTDSIMGDAPRRGWIGLIRDFNLRGARYTQPLLNRGHYLMIKEPDSAADAVDHGGPAGEPDDFLIRDR